MKKIIILFLLSVLFGCSTTTGLTTNKDNVKYIEQLKDNKCLIHFKEYKPTKISLLFSLFKLEVSNNESVKTNFSCDEIKYY